MIKVMTIVIIFLLTSLGGPPMAWAWVACMQQQQQQQEQNPIGGTEKKIGQELEGRTGVGMRHRIFLYSVHKQIHIHTYRQTDRHTDRQTCTAL